MTKKFNPYPLLKCPPLREYSFTITSQFHSCFKSHSNPFTIYPQKMILTNDKEVQKVTPKPETKRSQTSLWTRRRRLLCTSGTSRKSRQSRKINNLKVPFNIKIWKIKPWTFSWNVRLLTVTQLGSDVRQIWSIIDEENTAFNMCPPPTTSTSITGKHLENLFQESRSFCSSSLDRALKLTFSWDIVELSLDNTIKTGQGSMWQAVGVVFLAMGGCLLCTVYIVFSWRPWGYSVEKVWPFLSIFWWPLERSFLANEKVPDDSVCSFLTMSRSSFSRVWNAVLEHDFDPIKKKSGTNNRDVILFHVDFIGKFDLVSKVS